MAQKRLWLFRCAGCKGSHSYTALLRDVLTLIKGARLAYPRITRNPHDGVIMSQNDRAPVDSSIGSAQPLPWLLLAHHYPDRNKEMCVCMLYILYAYIYIYIDTHTHVFACIMFSKCACMYTNMHLLRFNDIIVQQERGSHRTESKSHQTASF